MKPKLWDGPSPVGEARDRGNKMIDAPYLSASAPGFEANKKGQFSEVTLEGTTSTTEEPVLFASGHKGDEFKKRGTTNLHRTFTTSKVTLRDYNLGDGYSAEMQGTRTYATEIMYVWTRRDGTGKTPMEFGYYAGEMYPSFYRRSYLGSLTVDSHTAAISYNIGSYIIWQIIPTGRLSNQNRARSMTFYNVMSGEVNDWGRGLSRVQYVSVYENCTQAVQANLPYPPDVTGNRDYMLGQAFNFGPNSVGVFVAQMALDAKEHPSGAVLDTNTTNTPPTAVYEKAQGAMWLYTTTDDGASWNIRRFTPLDELVTVAGEPNRVEPRMGYMWMTDSEGHFAAYNGSIGLQGIILNDFLALTSVTVFSPTTWVLFSLISSFGRILIPPAPGVGSLEVLAYRTTDAGATWKAITPPLEGLWLYDPVVLRDSVALIRAVQNLQGLGRTIKFLRSYDKGLTWSEIAFTGLPATTNEHIGYFEVLKVENVDGVPKTTVAVPCYSTADQAYIMYTSEDDGATWKEGPTIQKSEVFRRVDMDLLQNPTNDGIGNFGSLDYRGSIEKPQPLDIAQPWRYDADIPPPTE